jgi:hypothetical protein
LIHWRREGTERKKEGKGVFLISLHQMIVMHFVSKPVHETAVSEEILPQNTKLQPRSLYRKI